MIGKDTTSELNNLALCLFLKHVTQTGFEFVVLLPLPPKISEITSLYTKPGHARLFVYDIYVYVYLTIFAFLIKLIPIMFFVSSYE